LSGGGDARARACVHGEGPHALWHVSEDPGLTRFAPHRAVTAVHVLGGGADQRGRRPRARDDRGSRRPPTPPRESRSVRSRSSGRSGTSSWHRPSSSVACACGTRVAA